MVPSALSRRRSSFRPGTAFCLVTALLTAGCAPHRPPYDESAYAFTPDHVAEGALHGRTGAVFTVSDAAARIDIRLVDLPGLLYRVRTPGGSGLAPQVGGPDRKPRLALRPTGDDGPDVVTVLLNRTVRWTLATPRGGGEQILDLRDGRITGAVLGAAGRVDLMLPPAHETVPITLAGPVGSLSITAPRGTPVQYGRSAGTARKRYVVTAEQAITTYSIRHRD
jgi:hypothetical protein